jgi:hypothetical protein
MSDGLVIECDRCDAELSELGGLALAPPDEIDRAFKYHLCRPCWNDFMSWLRGDA